MTDVAVERRSPEVVFALLGDETRLAVLRALQDLETPASFSALREHVGTSDSGQFNYHLGKLVGPFVRRREDGYELTHAGSQVVGAMLAGTYTASASVDPIELDATCGECGATLEASYGDEMARVVCPTEGCDGWHTEFGAPPGVLEGYPEREAPRVLDRYLRTLLAGTVAGFCPLCDGRLDPELTLPGDAGTPVAQFACERCGETVRTSVFPVLAFHPAVVAFFHEHGVDVQSAPTWAAAEVTDVAYDVESTDPPRVAVTLTVDGDALRATLGPDAAVERVDAPS